MPDETVWVLDPHTKAKHAILRGYLGGWYPILAAGGWNRRVLFIDGFAGPGVYEGGEEGSPIVALRTLLDHSMFDRLSRTEFVFFFFESDKQRFASLDAELQSLVREYDPWPTNVKYHAHCMTFAEAGEKMLEGLGEAKFAPMFAFIDPFGLAGLPMDLVRRLSQFDKAEVFINFMTMTAVRFFEKGVIDHTFEELYGTGDHPDVPDGVARKDHVRDLYEARLREFCNFTHVLGFEMVNLGGHGYQLFYGTRHQSGLKVMKDAMWRVDESGSYKFSDRDIGRIDLFGGIDVARAAVKSLIVERLSGREMSVEQIESWVLADTPYTSSHFKKPLAELEKEGFVTVVHSTRKGTWGFPAGTIVKFG